jgi:hypothetical protein
MDLQEKEGWGLNRIYLAEYREKWCGLVNTAVNL